MARFTEDLLITQVLTSPTQRLANFAYAAPEQRVPGAAVSLTADIYALGLMLNEMFTGVVPHGTEYRSISEVAPSWKFLDPIVGMMLRQTPEGRPASIADIKKMIQQSSYESVSLQKLSEIDDTVIKASEIDDPLATNPPVLMGIDWNQGELTLILDRPVNQAWTNAFYQMNSFTSVHGIGPGTFRFQHDRALTIAPHHVVQQVVDYFKTWLPGATRTLNAMLVQDSRAKELAERDNLRQKLEAEEQRLKVLQQIKI